MPGVAEIIKRVIYEMSWVIDLKLVHWLDAENVNLTHTDVNTSIDKPQN